MWIIYNETYNNYVCLVNDQEENETNIPMWMKIRQMYTTILISVNIRTPTVDKVIYNDT